MSVLVGKDTSVLLKQVRVPEKQEVKHQMARSTLMQNQGIHHQHKMKKLTAVKYRLKPVPEILRPHVFFFFFLPLKKLYVRFT